MAVNLVLPVNVASNGLISTPAAAAAQAEGQPFDFAALLGSQLIEGEESGEATAALLGDTVRRVKQVAGKADPQGEAKGLHEDLPSADILAALAAGQLPPPAQAHGEANATLGSTEDIAVNSENTEETSDQNTLLAALGLPAAQLPINAAPTEAKATPPGLAIRDLAQQRPAPDNARPMAPYGLAIGTERQATGEASATTANLAAENSAQGTSFADTLSALQEPRPAPAAQASAMASAATGTAHSDEIKAHVSEVQWKHEFGERIVWMAKSDTQSAQLNLNPPQLGPLQITLNLSGDQASASFASPHAEVRQAIEDALPRLREMLASSGISLGDANVGAQLPQQRENTQQFAGASRSSSETAILTDDAQPAQSGGSMALQRGRGLVDLFA